MRLVQLPVTKVVVLLTLLVPCLSVTFEDGSSGSEARGESFEIRNGSGNFPNFEIWKVNYEMKLGGVGITNLERGSKFINSTFRESRAGEEFEQDAAREGIVRLDRCRSGSKRGSLRGKDESRMFKRRSGGMLQISGFGLLLRFLRPASLRYERTREGHQDVK